MQRHALSYEGRPISFRQVVELWQRDACFRLHFNDLLCQSTFDAYRLETPPVSTGTLDQDFEFVLLRCDALKRPVDVTAFADHFGSNDEIVTFPNLGHDATLVVPCPGAPLSCYGHLASFFRDAPESQRHRLWQTVGMAMHQRINEQPVWLSTAGMGISWLHIRLDDRPKYYGHLPYRH